MVLDKIKEMLAEKTGSSPSEINGDAKFTEMGFDSLDIAEILLNIEETFGVSVQASSEIVTLNDLTSKVEAAIAAKQ
jgi:acyl carrier protein